MHAFRWDIFKYNIKKAGQAEWAKGWVRLYVWVFFWQPKRLFEFFFSSEDKAIYEF